jgi:hypothetical protein
MAKSSSWKTCYGINNGLTLTCLIIGSILFIIGVFVNEGIGLSLGYNLSDEKKFWETTCIVNSTVRTERSECSVTFCNTEVNCCKVLATIPFNTTSQQCVSQYIVGRTYTCWASNVREIGDIRLTLRLPKTKELIIGISVYDSLIVLFFILAGLGFLFRVLIKRKLDAIEQASLLPTTTTPTPSNKNKINSGSSSQKIIAIDVRELSA